jgi:hypothetical protein
MEAKGNSSTALLAVGPCWDSLRNCLSISCCKIESIIVPDLFYCAVNDGYVTVLADYSLFYPCFTSLLFSLSCFRRRPKLLAFPQHPPSILLHPM